MNLIEAQEKYLDVYMFAATAERLQIAVAITARIAGREVHEFTDHIGTTEVRCVAVGPRPDAGKIAKDMKERRKKTVREFIQEE
jgi:hypothetical protein